ncbi:MAG: T9SS type A sorting domain-containing protein [Sphingobacteriaceae bacterium]|nr:T9SS type A sorting domain-containing protein [Sphingobacteriaceae bacterium]
MDQVCRRALETNTKNDTTIRLVYITNGTGNGFEMQLPFNPTPSFTSISYTDQKVINSWKRVIDTFKVAFPNHYLTNDFHPVNSSNAVADSVYLYARTKLPNRYGANAWWWTQNNTTLYASQYSILQHSSSNNIFSGVQIARSHTTDSALFGAGGIYGALSLAISNNVCYWEVWNQDIINTKLNALFTNSTTCTTLTDIHNKQNENEQIVIYPNPCSGRISLSIKTTAEFILIDRIGKIVFKKIITEDNSQNIQLPILPSGVYFARLETNGQYHYKKLMIEY